MTVDYTDEVQQLRILWRKARNMYSSFYTRLDAVRQEIGDERFADWCYKELNISLSILNKTADVLREYDAERVRDELKNASRIAQEAKLKAAEEARQKKLRVKEEKALEAFKRKQERAAAQLRKNAIADDARKSQAAWDKLKAAEKRKAAKAAAAARGNPKGGKAEGGKTASTRTRRSKSTPATTHTNGNGSVTDGNAVLAAVLSGLAKKLRALRKQDVGVRENWVKVTLAKAEALAEVRDKITVDIAFGKWLVDNGFDTWLGKNERAALINFGKNIELARTVLEQSTSMSAREIWEAEKHRFPAAGKPPFESDISEDYQGDTLH